MAMFKGILNLKAPEYLSVKRLGLTGLPEVVDQVFIVGKDDSISAMGLKDLAQVCPAPTVTGSGQLILN